MDIRENANVIKDKTKYAKEYEGYFFEKNKGYPTKDHKNAINYLGLSNIHRKSFKI